MNVGQRYSGSRLIAISQRLKANSMHIGQSVRRLSILPALLGLLMCVGVAENAVALEPASKQTAHLWLKQMAASFRQRDYDGVLVSSRGSEMRSVRILHLVRDEMEYERLEYLDGKSVDVQRRAHPVDCVHSGKELISKSDQGGLFSAYSSNSVSLQDGVYSLDVLPQSRVAGRSVEVISVSPNDEHRYKHRLFLDQSTQLLLKSQVLDKQDNVLESFQFSQIQIDDEVTADDLPDTAVSTIEEPFHTLPIDTKTDPVPWRLGWMPAGFVAASQRSTVVNSPGFDSSDAAIHSMHYTDGFALFSVFLQSRDAEVEALETRVGSTLAYVAPKKLRNGWASVTVVGELPIATAVKIAQSLEEEAVAVAVDNLE